MYVTWNESIDLQYMGAFFLNIENFLLLSIGFEYIYNELSDIPLQVIV